MANSDNKAFDMMTVAADKTAVELFPVEFEKSTKSVHNALMAAGMTPAYGNIADLADAALYALEGEFGDAAWSAAAAIPVIGQMVVGRKAAKVAKEAGEEIVTLYRGVDKWYPGKMVKEGKFIGGGQFEGYMRRTEGIHGKDKTIWASKDKLTAEGFAGRRAWWEDAFMTKRIVRERTGPLLEFEVPKRYIDKFGKFEGDYGENAYSFIEGIPKEFLKKVHK